MFQDDNENDEDENIKKEQKAIELQARQTEMLKRSEVKHRLRQMHLERKETSKAEKLQRAREASELKARQTELEQRLAKELSHRKFIELQESIKKRKAASKIQSVSICNVKHLETSVIKEKKREDELRSSKLNNTWYLGGNLDITQQHQKKLNYRKELQNQIIDNCRKQREKEEEKHRERKINEQIGETIRREDLEAEKHKKKTAFLLQAERDAFLKARQFWKDKRREVLKREHEVISKMISEKEALQRKEAEKKSDTNAIREGLVEKLSNELKEGERRKAQREEICRELYLAEKESQLANEAIRLALSKKRTAKEQLQDMARHQKVLAEKKAKEDAIDAAFARHLAEEQRNLQAKEKQKEQARREKVIQYGNELRETIRRNQIQHSKSVRGDKTKSDTNECKCEEKGDIVASNVNSNITLQKSAICT